MAHTLMIMLTLSLASFVGTTRVAASGRYAVVIGNNRGDSDEVPLKYAERDARKVADVLRHFGDVPAENLVLIEGETVEGVRRAILGVNDRLRQEYAGTATLIVYYSGHADAESLHLGGTHFSLRELEMVVRGSASAFRLLVLDACRSGALTRVKGMRPVAPVAVRVQGTSSSGAVFLTASASDEDAQESDDVQGSFFTHYFVSGLRGAADRNNDGFVELEEVYAYAYQHTLRASSRSLFGAQHPTYRHDIRGRGRLVLSRLGQATNFGWLTLPKGQTWFVMADHAEGPVIAEVGANDWPRRIALEPRRYFVRGRAEGQLFEGSVQVAARQTREVRTSELERFEYARLVRKGRGRWLGASHGVEAGYRLRSALESGGALCHGAFGGYVYEASLFTLRTRLGYCAGGFDNMSVSAKTQELDLELRAHRAFDISAVLTFEAGFGVGGSWLHQSFDTRAVAPDRNSAAWHADAGLMLSYALGRGFFIGLEGAAMLYLFEQTRADAEELRIRPVYRGAIALRKTL